MRPTGPRGRQESKREWEDPAYADFSFKREAPRVDATRREEPDRPESTGDEDGGKQERSRRRRSGIEDRLFDSTSELPSYDADVDRVVEKLYREIERKMRIERERKGL